ncbi:hypothetical protein I8751_24070 [Nostocaceae cyanobacterium CENA357]|uniref:Transposase n=2 Tax=Atlanticothrix silvestris CENA357 TaxID=1725252 RepID=A0A8J7HLZ0_9CYAN|nr:hypothetical protein [Atlanticothrix silvestris]MBH8555366.1 hypothetical protein [Atlanticothrix silvestris CENA357]
MLPSFYQEILEKYLSNTQLITLKMLVWLLQSQKQVKIERLAATLPLPIQQNSRRRHLQRFLNSNALSVVLLWFPIIEEILSRLFKLRQKKSTTFREKRQKFQPLHTIPIYPGVRRFYLHVNLTQKKGFGRCNLAVYWKRKYRSHQELEPWYLSTNLPDLSTALKIYAQRFGIEAMFRDCKTGGYNLEGSQANPDRMVRLILLIALAMTSAWLQGQKTQLSRQQYYVCRPCEQKRSKKRHSAFWIGLYGQNWITSLNECQELVLDMMAVVRNKQAFYHQGLRAMLLIQQPL